MNQQSLLLDESPETDGVENKLVSLGILPQDIWEPITAFSNADGGVIKLGVGRDGTRVGVGRNFIDKLQGEIFSRCSSAFNHKLYPDIKVDPDGVINVYIPPAPASLRPIYSTSRGLKGGRVRVGTSNAQLDDEWVRRFAIAAGGGAEIQTYRADYRQYFDEVMIGKYLEAVRKKRGGVYDSLSTGEVLVKLRAISSSELVTLFGLLAFGIPNSINELVAPTLNVAVTQYAGIDKVNPEDIAEVSLDDKEFSGNAVSQFENALSFILSKMPVRSRIDPEGKRRNYLAIPDLAIREVLANSIVHRDYSTMQSRVQIDIYSDRVEFANPGRSLVPLDLIETAHPQTRNPLLMSYLRDLNITEHRGRGIRTIKASLRSAGLDEPTFVHRHDWFVATIHKSAFIGDEDMDWLEQFRRYNLNDRQLSALVHARHNRTGINNSDYREINNMNSVKDDIRAKKELAKLLSLGLVEKTGEKRYRRYVFNKRAR